MELYIAEYLVENRFADDIVSALKILKVVSDDWYNELRRIQKARDRTT